MQKILLFLILFLSVQSLSLAQSYWKTKQESSLSLSNKSVRHTVPQKYKTYELHLEQVKNVLATAPAKNDASKNASIWMPLPDGGTMEFAVFEALVMHPNLAAKYPMIKTYKGYNADKSAKIYLDITTKGLHALIDYKGKSIYIDPYAVFQDKYYISYYAKDLLSNELRSQFMCGVDDEHLAESDIDFSFDKNQQESALQKSSAGEPVVLRTYRMAIACTGEYTDFHGGTVQDGLSAVATALNRLNMVFERDLAIHMELIERNDEIIFINGNTDPFTNGQTDALIDESQTTIDNIIGWSFYDFGHVFSRGGYAGLAQLGAACSNSKARGASTMGSPVNDAFVISIVGHEMGHQMGANHSMSSCHNVNSGTAYEPGSGSTIMSYAGICGAENNIVGDSDDYYFTYSLSEMFNFTRNNNGNSCANRVVVENTTPDVTIPIEDGFYIPISTPFEMAADAIDTEGDFLTYSWEQLDLGPMSIPGYPEGDCPLFRSFPPTENSMRIFPKMESIVNNSSTVSEILPPYSRDMTFRCTVRDNNMLGGGVSWDLVEFEATNTAGPFLVESPNSAIEWKIGSYAEVRWDVANTNNALVNCQEVDILLSLDGGYTYPIVLAEKSVNDGLDYVLVPNEISNQARVKIKASDNIFFDISNANFNIREATEASYSLAATPDFFQVCLPEVVSVDILTTASLGFDENIELSILSGLPADAMASFTNTNILPTENSQLFLDFSNVTTEDTYEIVLQAIAPNADTLLRSIVLKTVSNDFSSLILDTPNDGTSGISGVPEFNWVFANDANSYSIQIATSPSFSTETLIDEANGLTETPYNPGFLFEENTLYYWRVTPTNECGTGKASKIFAFHTESITCNKEDAFDTPVTISGSTAPTLESKISVLADGTISAIRVSELKGNHAFFSDLRVSLISPSGTTAVLFTGKCANFNGNFNLTLDDEAPLAFSCPPNGTMRPQQALSAFIGESTAGLWTLKIEDTVGGGGSGGIIDDWSLEFCSDINLNNPQVLTNIEMPLPPNTSRKINSAFLYAEDSDNEDWQLRYTLVSPVQNGSLFLEGEELQVGEQFNQAEITWDKLSYQHDGSETTSDSFDFTIADGDGGWTGTHTFQIVVDPNVVVSSNEVLENNSLVVFPNPASKSIYIKSIDATKAVSQIQIYTILGEALDVKIINTNNNTSQLDISNLPKGVYIIQAQIGAESFSRKVSVL